MTQILELLDREIATAGSRLALVGDNGALDESSLVGTRDAYLQLARAIVAFVAQSEAAHPDGQDITRSDDGFWTDSLNKCFFAFPTVHEPNLVGSYLYPEHGSVLGEIRRLLGSTCPGWEKDPQFEALSGQ